MILLITRDILKEYVTNSSTYLNWSITLIGASFLSIISNSYYKPEGKIKLIYFLLFPAWLFLGISIGSYQELFNLYTGTSFLNPENNNYKDELIKYGIKINAEYDKQICYFLNGCYILIVWFVLIVSIWIFDNKKQQSKN